MVRRIFFFIGRCLMGFGEEKKNFYWFFLFKVFEIVESFLWLEVNIVNDILILFVEISLKKLVLKLFL